jgi:hypothetical protein
MFLAASRLRTVEAFRVTSEFQLLALSLVPSVLPEPDASGLVSSKSTIHGSGEQHDRFTWLAGIVLSLIADSNRMAAREAGFACLELVCGGGGGGGAGHLSPAWTFLFSGLRSRKDEIILDPE